MSPACTSRAAVEAVLRRRRPPRVVYAPNYWQWHAHHRRHATLPDELAHASAQLDVIRHLELDVFSRNVYCDQQRCWFGGLAQEVLDGVDRTTEEEHDGADLLLTTTYHTCKGPLSERRRYVHAESTLVQETYLVEDPDTQLAAFEEIVAARRWRFLSDRFREIREAVGDTGVAIAGEFYSPLKLLHLALGPARTVFLLADHPERTAEILAQHENAQLDLLQQALAAGVRAVMAMDNLDTTFHPPPYVERYSASFYERASARCHAHDAVFLIHACGRQQNNLALVSSLGVDGLEGVAFPPLGDVTLREAFEMTRDDFIITGGISAMETRHLTDRQAVFAYVRGLLVELAPFAHRFMLAASCNTAIDARWETLVHLRDAWREYGAL